MVRALPSAIPSKMYRHFALVTVLLTTSVAMFADGEGREARATQVAEHDKQEALRQEAAEQVAKPTITRRVPQPRHRFAQEVRGFDVSFGAPMDSAAGSLTAYARELTAGVTQAGYSDAYLASLGSQERDLLLEGLAREGLLSPEERERKSAALVAASRARRGGSRAND